MNKFSKGTSPRTNLQMTNLDEQIFKNNSRFLGFEVEKPLGYLPLRSR